MNDDTNQRARETLLAAGMDEAAVHATGGVPYGVAVQAITSAREEALREAAEICATQQKAFLSPQYATGQPLSSFGERFACGKCRDEILSLITGGGERG